MTPRQNHLQQRMRPLVLDLMDKQSPYDMAADHLRYEKLRTLNTHQFQALRSINLVEGTPFDQLVDELVIGDLAV